MAAQRAAVLALWRGVFAEAPAPGNAGRRWMFAATLLGLGAVAVLGSPRRPSTGSRRASGASRGARGARRSSI
jgi:hypothetical protein